MNVRWPSILLLLASLSTGSAAQEPSPAEIVMKTDALSNLPRYVEWPPGAFVMPKTPLMIGVYGQTKIHKALLQNLDGKVLNGRVVMVRRFRWPQAPNAHVLFIAKSERHRLGWIMKKVQHSTTLTVSEFDDFMCYGGIVRISMKDEKLRFHVNATVTKDVGLRLSSKFLGVADQVVGEH